MAKDLGKLEPEYADAYQAWKTTPNPASTTQLLKTVQPSIDRAISAHVGQGNPILRSKAKVMALHAMRSYDPKQARIGTHLMNQLQGLKRANRQQQQIISVPERIVIEHGHMQEAENELRDRLGRDPTDMELADHTGVSRKRLMYIRRYHNPMAEGAFSQLGGEESEGGFAPAIEQSPSQHWAELVYQDADPTNQAIIEHSFGMHGKPVLPNHVLASKLGISPGAVSQRRALIQQKLNEQQSLSPFGA